MLQDKGEPYLLPYVPHSLQVKSSKMYCKVYQHQPIWHKFQKSGTLNKMSHIHYKEERNLSPLLDVLGNIFIPDEGQDSRSWSPFKDGLFPIASFFKALWSVSAASRQLDLVWKSEAPRPRVLIFGWLVLRGSILSIDNLRQLNMIIINACLCWGRNLWIIYP